MQNVERVFGTQLFYSLQSSLVQNAGKHAKFQWIVGAKAMVANGDRDYLLKANTLCATNWDWLTINCGKNNYIIP